MGSVPTCLAHWQAGAAHDLGAVLPAGSVTAHTGQLYVGQHVVGSTPTCTGGWPFAHARAVTGQLSAGFIGSQVGLGGTHWPTHVRPLHAPLASQLQLLSARSQPHAGGCGGVIAPVPGSVLLPALVFVGVPMPVPPGMQAHSRQATSHTCPIGQSELAWQPVCGLSGMQMP